MLVFEVLRRVGSWHVVPSIGQVLTWYISFYSLDETFSFTYVNFVYLVIRSNHHLPYSLLQFRHSPLLHCLTMQVPQAAPLIGWSRLSEFHNSTTGHNNPTKSLNIVPAFTDQFVVTTVNPPITFTASTVSDWEKYTSIGIYTDVASTKVYSGGLVWEPIVPNGAPSPTVTVPVNVIPTAAHMSLDEICA